jgi:hypothetical protein
MSRGRRNKSATDLFELTMLAPWVVAARVTSAMTNLRKGKVDHVENARMWTEKGAAVAESWTKANAAFARAAFALPFSNAQARATRALAAAMTGPARKTVVGNARRLSAKSRR